MTTAQPSNTMNTPFYLDELMTLSNALTVATNSAHTAYQKASHEDEFGPALIQADNLLKALKHATQAAEKVRARIAKRAASPSTSPTTAPLASIPL